MPELVAARCQNAANNAAIVEVYDNPAEIGIRWNLRSFGLERMEVVVRTSGRYEAFQRYQKYLGQRIAVYGYEKYRPISGWIAEIKMLPGARIKYICRGVEWLAQQQHDTTPPTATETINTRLGGNLNNLLDGYSVVSDTRNLAANADTLQGWTVRTPVGITRDEVIRDMLRFSISGITPPDKAAIYDFWFQDEPFNGVDLQRFIPNYAARSTSATADWIVNLDDITSLDLSRNINPGNIVTSAKIYYGALTGSVTTSDAAGQTLTDSGASFTSEGIAQGDRITNNTDQSHAVVTDIVDANNIRHTTLSGGSDNQWDSAAPDAYTIHRQNPQTIHTAGGSTITASRWRVEHNESQPDMTAAQATAYAKSLLNDTPEQVQSFTITAPMVTHKSGAKLPLWKMIEYGGGYIQIADLYPAAELFTSSLNNLTTFRITAMDYNHSQRRISVHVDTLDRRLDARLRAAGILNSEAIL